MPVTLNYEAISIWTIKIFNMEIFYLFLIFVRKVFAQDTFWERNRFKGFLSACSPICLVLLHSNYRLIQSKFRKPWIIECSLTPEIRCLERDSYISTDKILRRCISIRCFYKCILLHLCLTSVNHVSELIWKYSDNKAKYHYRNYTSKGASEFFLSSISHCNGFSIDVKSF